MATRLVTVYTDDLTGEDVDHVETIQFVSGGMVYEIDLCEATRKEYEDLIKPYADAGRRVGRASIMLSSPLPSPARIPAKVDAAQNKAVREWWRANEGKDGLPKLVERGRIPQAVMDAFQTWGGKAIVEDVPPAKEPRKPGTVGAEIKFRAAEPAKIVPVQKTAKSAPAKATAASVKRGAAKAAQPAAKRAVRRAAAK